METTDLRQIILEQPFFDDIAEEFLDLLVGCASHVLFKQGHFLLTEGHDADNFYIIKRGKVAIEVNAGDKGPVTIQTLTAGDILGWSWIIPPYKWHFDALAVEATSAIAFDGRCLRGKCESNYNFGFDMLKRMAGVVTYRLLSTRMQLMDYYG